jgi:ribonuclease HI
LNVETTQHLFLDCVFTEDVWRKIKSVLNFSGTWDGTNLNDCFKRWKILNFNLQSLPSLICWNIWREQNQDLFEDKEPLVLKVSHLSIMSLRDHALAPKLHFRRLGKTQAGMDGVVGWFDGATASSGSNNGAGGVIKISEQCSYKWLLNCGLGSNTRAKLLGSWATLTLASRLSLPSIHILGDSKIIIEWLRGKGRLQVISLDCWKDKIMALISSFQKISFDHVYREENQVADCLSKQALTIDPGKLTFYQCIEEHEGPHISLDLY